MTNIENNEKADLLAKLGSNNPPEDDNFKGHPREHWPLYKMKIWKDWTTEWQKISVQKGRIYAHLRGRIKLNSKPWFAEYPHLARKAIATINRLRSGHCCSPDHLFRIRVLQTDRCLCGEQGDLNHIFFGCSNNEINCQTLYSALARNVKNAPFTIYDCLTDSKLKETTISIITAFISSSHIKL